MPRCPSPRLLVAVSVLGALALLLACGDGEGTSAAPTSPGAATSTSTRPPGPSPAASTAPAGGPSSPAAVDGAPRSFRMGFTPFPFAGDIDSFIAVAQAIAGFEDLAVHHFDAGVPWPQALVDDTYPSGFDSELTGRATTSPRGAARFVAVTPLSGDRSGLALLRGSRENEPLPAPWDTASLDDPDVIAAFTNYARHVIARLEPDYFAYVIEANMLLEAAPDQWPALVTLAGAVYPALKEAYPELPIFVTVQAEWFHGDRAAQAERLAELMPYSDMLAVSTYGYVRGLNPLAIDGYLDPLVALAPDKPFAISETGWPAELPGAPFPDSPAFSPTGQAQYVAWLLDQADSREAAFVCWFVPRDFDAYWERGLRDAPGAATARAFRDLGLWDGDGAPRPALSVWLEWFERPFEGPR